MLLVMLFLDLCIDYTGVSLGKFIELHRYLAFILTIIIFILFNKSKLKTVA